MQPLITNLFGGKLPALMAFDLDGTLVDSAADLTLAVDAMLETLGRPPAGDANVRRWIGNGAAILVRRALANTDDAAAVQAIEEASLAEAITVFRRCYQRVNGTVSRLYDGVTEVLEAAHIAGCRLAIVTNKPKVFADPLLTALGVDHYFSTVIGGECLPRKKPDPLPLQHLLSLWQVAPSAALMVGDSTHDVNAARAAGLPVVCRRDGYNHGVDIALSAPDALFTSFREWL